MSKQYDKLSSALKSRLPATALDALGRIVGFIRRLREIEASLFVWSVVMSRFGHGRPGFEQARQWFARLGGPNVYRRPFQIRFKATAAVRLFERAFDVAVSQWRLRQLARTGHPLAKCFTDVVAIDTTWIQVSDALSETFKPVGKRRLDGTRVAMMKVLLCISVFGLVPLHASIHGGAEHDTQLFPSLDRFARGTLLLFDKGFFWKKHLKAMAAHGLHYLFPMKKYCSPIVVGVAEAPAYARAAFARSRKVALRKVLHKDARVASQWDLDVLVDGEIPARLVIVPGARGHQRCYLTTIARCDCSPAAVAEIYRLRWQIELVFKELKQDLNLTSVPTSNASAAQVFIWASLIALAVSRAICVAAFPATQRLGLAHRARPMLVTRALRGTLKFLAHAWNAPRAVQEALLGIVLGELSREHDAVARGRPDSFARLEKLMAAAA